MPSDLVTAMKHKRAQVPVQDDSFSCGWRVIVEEQPAKEEETAKEGATAIEEEAAKEGATATEEEATAK